MVFKQSGLNDKATCFSMWLNYLHIRTENVIKTYLYNLGDTKQERMRIRAKRPGRNDPGQTGIRAKRLRGERDLEQNDTDSN